jgi:hypothetical protein
MRCNEVLRGDRDFFGVVCLNVANPVGIASEAIHHSFANGVLLPRWSAACRSVSASRQVSVLQSPRPKSELLGRSVRYTLLHWKTKPSDIFSSKAIASGRGVAPQTPIRTNQPRVRLLFCLVRLQVSWSAKHFRVGPHLSSDLKVAVMRRFGSGGRPRPSNTVRRRPSRLP